MLFRSEIDSRAQKAVFEKSETFFGGRRFSQERISAAYHPGVSENGQFSFKMIDTTHVKNQYGAQKTSEDIAPGSEISALIRLDGAFFGKRSWELGYSASQVKLYMEVHPQDWNLDMTVDCRPTKEDIVDAAEVISVGGDSFVDDEDFYTDVEGAE